VHPILLSVGGFEIPTYGVLVAAGWLLGARWGVSRRGDMGLSEDDIWNVLYWVFAGAFVGGKLLYFIVSPESLTWSFDALRYGFVFYGGFLGSFIFGWWYCRRRGFSFLHLGDYFATGLALGHGIGRLGCLMAGCCYGRHTEWPWGVALAGDPSRHPTQVYEAALNLALFGVLVRFGLPRVQDGRWRRGSVMMWYLFGYGLLRFFVEFFRGDDRGNYWAGLSPSQWLAMLTIVAAATFLSRRRTHE
jgi:phosphatidylglycerol:prolipoprotein diacylglycerol transferase